MRTAKTLIGVFVGPTVILLVFSCGGSFNNGSWHQGALSPFWFIGIGGWNSFLQEIDLNKKIKMIQHLSS